jgi:hypothetical protein
MFSSLNLMAARPDLFSSWVISVTLQGRAHTAHCLSTSPPHTSATTSLYGTNFSISTSQTLSTTARKVLLWASSARGFSSFGNTATESLKLFWWPRGPVM